MTSGSCDSHDGTVDARLTTPSNTDDGDSSPLRFEGVDFTHSTGFDTVNNATEDTRPVHDRYCIQTRLRGQTGGTTVCTCTNIPTL